jgi:hypothetical protein
MGWCTHRSLAHVGRDGWAWQSANRKGYAS